MTTNLLLRAPRCRAYGTKTVEHGLQIDLRQPELEGAGHATQLRIPRLASDVPHRVTTERPMLPDVLEPVFPGSLELEVGIRGSLDVVHDEPSGQEDGTLRILHATPEADHVSTNIFGHLA